MSYFAQVQNGIVQQVLSVEQDVINSGIFGNPAEWIQTSYNTRGGIHYGPDGKPDGGVALRANFAGIGYVYDVTNDVFYNPNRPLDMNGLVCNSWTMGPSTWIWQPPTPQPKPTKIGYYAWNEATQQWVLVDWPVTQ